MYKGKKLLNFILVTALMTSFLFVFDNGTMQEVQAAGSPVTMIGLGHKQAPNVNSVGDHWDSTWLANDKVYVMHDDGYGFGGTGGPFSHDGVCELTGNPESMPSVSGTNLNPGSLGNFLGGTYGTGIYEADGVLYHNICYSIQDPNNWQFYNCSIMKSTDGGANWINHLGQTNILPPNSSQDSMFPDNRWGFVNFVKYGKGGAAPNPDVDNAQTYVYMYSLDCTNGNGFYLARIRRSDLPSLDKTKIQFYKGGEGGDGMNDLNWTNQISQSTPFTMIAGSIPCLSITYNPGLGRYILFTVTGNSWSNPPKESSFRAYEAPHLWGPWTPLLDENVNNKEGDNLAWPNLMQK